MICTLSLQLPVRTTHASMENVWRPSIATGVSALQVFMEKSANMVIKCIISLIHIHTFIAI